MHRNERSGLQTHPENQRISILSSSTDDLPAHAVMLMLGALLMLGLQDALAKLLSTHTSIWQFQMLRAAMNFTLLLLIFRLAGRTQYHRPASYGS